MPDNVGNIRDLIREEYKKCAKDAAYFMKKYVKIQHQERGIILFNTYKFQDETITQLQSHSRNIVLKSRQMGISTLVAAYSLWTMLFSEGKNILVLSIKQDTAKEVVTKVKLAYNHLPAWLKLPATENSALMLKLSNQSKIMAASSASDAARSFSASILILDEAAFIDNAEEVWTAAQQTLATVRGNAIILSTPNGVGNFFHKLWTDAELGKNEFNRIKLPWHLHPERNQTWRENQTKELGPKKAAQECFSRDTIVYTDGGPKEIGDIKIGDRVLTHTGNYKKVINIFSHEDHPKRLTTSKNHLHKFVTDNHPFYYNGNWVDVKNMNGKETINFPNDFYLSNNITTVDLFELTNPKFFRKVLCESDNKFFINDRKHKIVHNRFLTCDYEFGYLIGLYLAEGSGGRLRKTFCFDVDKELKGWPQKIESIVKNKFGFSHCQYRKIENSGQLSFCSEIFCNGIDSFVSGNDCYSKKLTSLAYKNMSTEFASGIIDGAFRGDGCLKNEYYKTYVSTSLSLIHDISYILHLIGVHNFSTRQCAKSGVESSIEGRKIICSDKWEIKILKSRGVEIKSELSSASIDESDNRITTVNFLSDSENSPQVVYNLEVEEDHTYVTEFGVVHNCDCDFLTSGNTVVDMETITFYRESKVCDPVEKRGFDRNYWLWEYPSRERNYLLTADVARGDGQDYSAFHVLDIENVSQCAEYKGQPGTKEFGQMLSLVAREWNNALLVVERENVGWAAIQQIIDDEYPNLFYSSADLKYVDVQRQITNKINASENKMVPGFGTTMKTRPLVIGEMESYFRERSIEVRSARLMDELSVFIWNGPKPQAMEGYNDDLVLSLSIGLWVRNTALRLRTEGINLIKNILGNISKQSPESTPIMKSKVHQTGYESWNMKTGRMGQNESLLWLIK